MKVTYLLLENIAVLYVAQNKDRVEINFPDSGNKLVLIQAANGKGKTALLSHISPFAYPTSIDERSSLSIIRDGKNGYKEIHYRNNNDLYVIKHYYKPNKSGGHSVKSYIALNGNELNDNGNVTSFLALVEMHLGLNQDMMRLIRLGSNVNSFISLSPAKRKEYFGSLIEEIDIYMKIYKKINEDIRVVKVLINSNHTNLYNCHVSDITVEESKLHKINKQIKENEKDRDKLVAKVSKIKSLERENNIEDLKLKRREAEASIFEFKRTEEKIKSLCLENTTVDKLVDKRSDLINQRIDIQSKINSYRILIDTNLKNIERLEISVKKVTSNNDLDSLTTIIDTLQNSIRNVNPIIKTCSEHACDSDSVQVIISKLSSFNQISQMINTFGSKPLNVYMKLRRENKSVDKFLKDQMKRNISRVNENDVRKLLSQLFQDDEIITPNCDTQFNDCPYYRFSETIEKIKDKIDEELLDDETLRYINVISNNIDNMLNEIDHILTVHIPDKFKDNFREKIILDRLVNNLPFFDLTSLYEYLTILKEYEVYKSNVEKLKQYEYQLSVYKKSGIDNQINEINDLRTNIVFYKNNVETLHKEINVINEHLETVNANIGLVTKYADGKKYQNIIESTLAATNKILVPLESATSERMELQMRLDTANSFIGNLRNESKILENKISDYNRLVKEEKILSKKMNHLSIILESVSTKKGIPVVYMKTYLGKIQKMANELLSVIYGDDLRLAKFKVTQETFEIPYVKNGTKIPDVKYASQSEVPLTTMALSFALSNKATGKYNILLLDEMDAGLDEHNRSSFLKMLSQQMRELHAEQVFLISHNLNNIIDIPIDVIKLSDISSNTKLQNVIYDSSSM